jgi:glycosyltransferase involved in cell wall biosynthesis
MFLNIWEYLAMTNSDEALVCICIPTYNVEKTIAETLHSILNQTYSNLIINIVDNHSTDDTVAIVEKFDDSRIHIFRNEKNIGGEGNFNRCIKLASGKYTALYHADDIYEPEMVAKQVRFLNSHSQASAVFTEALLINERGHVTGQIKKPSSLANADDLYNFLDIFKALLAHSNFLICPSVMALTHVYQQHVKAWNGQQFGSSADLDVWLRMLEYGPIGILPDKLMRYRVSDSQWSARVRLSVDRSAFFKVIDDYLSRIEINALLASVDLANYKQLENRDLVMRAANAFIGKQYALASNLCPNALSLDILYPAFHKPRGLAVFILSIYIRSMLFFRLYWITRESLKLFKKLMQK